MIQDVGDKCCGCTACATVCPLQCITMGKDFLGFSRPTVDENKCIQCGKCRQVCPALEIKSANMPQSAMCGWNTDDEMRMVSSSGGAFPAIASEVLAAGGIVYGAVFARDTKRIVHRSSKNVAMRDLQGSKYVQSDLGNTFRDVIQDLNYGKTVLFVGTPCQVNGLKNLEGGNKTNLLTCDFICHGVPSPLVFAEYLSKKERKYKSSVVSINFRDKGRGWATSSTRIEFDSGKTYCRRNEFDPFYQGFNDNVYLNDCCYKCMHNSTRSSDITLSDFWNYRVYDAKLDNRLGLSLVVANSELGKSMIDKVVSAGFHSEPVPLDIASIGLSGGAHGTGLSLRNKFAEAVGQDGVGIAFQKSIGVSSVGIIIRKVRRKGIKRLFDKLRRSLGG